jgi:hypothetical protein
MERQLMVMVLDTSPTTRKILEVILQREGHRVVCFNIPPQESPAFMPGEECGVPYLGLG